MMKINKIIFLILVLLMTIGITYTEVNAAGMGTGNTFTYAEDKYDEVNNNFTIAFKRGQDDLLPTKRTNINNMEIFCAQPKGVINAGVSGYEHEPDRNKVALPKETAFALAKIEQSNHSEKEKMQMKQAIIWLTPGLADTSKLELEPYDPIGGLENELGSQALFNEACDIYNEANTIYHSYITNTTSRTASFVETKPSVISSNNNIYKVGPYKINFFKSAYSGLTDMYLTTQDGTRINVTGYSGNNINSIKDINSGSEFYITFDATNVKDLNSIKLHLNYYYTDYNGTYTRYASVSNGYGIKQLLLTYNVEGGVYNKDATSAEEIVLTMDLGGTVFIDVETGKVNKPNGYLDDQDEKVEGIEVTLYNKSTGKPVEQSGLQNPTYTDKNGRYEFKGVSGAGEYYVRFKYNGMEYEPTTYQLLYKYDENGNKQSTTIAERSYATDGKKNRQAFNNKFAEITNSTDVSEANMQIYSYTGPDGLDNLKTYSRANTDEELDNINFGMINREDADLALFKDLYNVQLKINGKEQTYIYNSRAGEDMTISIRGSDIAPYERAIRKADLEYSGANKLEVYATYRISITNQSPSAISGEVTKLVDYADSAFEYVSSYKKYNGDTEVITENVSWTQEGQSNGYNVMRTTGTTGTTIKSGQTEDVYVIYKVDEQVVSDLLNSKERKLNNYAEIEAFKTYYTNERKDLNGIQKNAAGDIAGLIDRDSTPGNFEIPKQNFEDDADVAPGLKLIIDTENARTITGNVWEDNAEVINNTRLGDGIRQDAEKLINGAKVELLEVKNGEFIETGITAETVNGNYTLSGFIPGNYVIRFRYGTDKTLMLDQNGKIYTGQDYKSTIYTDKTKRLLGDINLDGVVDVADGMLLAQHVEGTAQINGEGLTLADVNQDGKVDSQDVSELGAIINGRKEAQQVESMYWYNEQDNKLSDAKDDWERRQTVNKYSETMTNWMAELFNALSIEDTDAREAKCEELRQAMISIGVNPNKYASQNGESQNSASQNITAEEWIRSVVAAGTSMFADTPTMSMEIEQGRTQTSINQDCSYKVEGIDFGIVERPRSELKINKEVANIKVVSSDGQTIIDTNKETQNVGWNDQFVQATMDDNLINGSTLIVEYAMSITNKGELDYNDQQFYYTGSPSKGATPVTTKADEVIDFIENNLSFDANLNDNWEVVTQSAIQKNSMDSLINNSEDLQTKLSSYRVIVKANSSTLKTALKPDETTGEEKITLTKVLANVDTGEEGENEDSLTYNNTVEIVKTQNSVGRRSFESTPGNLNPNEPDFDSAEEVMVIPPFGNSTIYYVIGAIGLIAILGVGVFFIKKKVL